MPTLCALLTLHLLFPFETERRMMLASTVWSEILECYYLSKRSSCRLSTQPASGCEIRGREKIQPPWHRRYTRCLAIDLIGLVSLPRFLKLTTRICSRIASTKHEIRSLTLAVLLQVDRSPMSRTRTLDRASVEDSTNESPLGNPETKHTEPVPNVRPVRWSTKLG